ncbi:MAG: NADH-quinone oxidoreductase subunit A [Vampirovibrionales bacterium]|nr:NADH-quinone oxidoreductase subunit A [Vampirovibrionales bacterium]
MMLLTGFPLLFALILLSGAFALLLLLIAQTVQFKAPSALKETTYESGMTPYGDARVRFDVKFYLFALMFILFDIETVFLFPWAVSFDQLGLFAFVEMILFLGILAIGLVYAWKKGALKWQ